MEGINPSPEKKVPSTEQSESKVPSLFSCFSCFQPNESNNHTKPLVAKLNENTIPVTFDGPFPLNVQKRVPGQPPPTHDVLKNHIPIWTSSNHNRQLLNRTETLANIFMDTAEHQRKIEPYSGKSPKSFSDTESSDSDDGGLVPLGGYDSKPSYHNVYSFKMKNNGPDVVGRILKDQHSHKKDQIIRHVFQSYQEAEAYFGNTLALPKIYSSNTQSNLNESIDNILNESLENGIVVMDRIEHPIEKLSAKLKKTETEIEMRTLLANIVFSSLAHCWQAGIPILPDFRFGNFALQKNSLYIIDFREEPLQEENYGSEIDVILKTWEPLKNKNEIKENLLKAAQYGLEAAHPNNQKKFKILIDQLKKF
jgi:hypothetical protein